MTNINHYPINSTFLHTPPNPTLPVPRTIITIHNIHITISNNHTSISYTITEDNYTTTRRISHQSLTRNYTQIYPNY